MRPESRPASYHQSSCAITFAIPCSDHPEPRNLSAFRCVKHALFVHLLTRTHRASVVPQVTSPRVRWSYQLLVRTPRDFLYRTPRAPGILQMAVDVCSIVPHAGARTKPSRDAIQDSWVSHQCCIGDMQNPQVIQNLSKAPCDWRLAGIEWQLGWGLGRGIKVAGMVRIHPYHLKL